MKIIVISGAHSSVGKTSLAFKLNELLDNSVRIKIGHHPEKPDGNPNYFLKGVTIESLKKHT